MDKNKVKILVKFNYLYDATTQKVLGKDCLVHLDINHHYAYFRADIRALCTELTKMDNVDYVDESGQECHIRYTKHKGVIG